VAAVLTAIVGAVLPEDVGLQGPLIWKAVVFAVIGYVIGVFAEYVFRLLRAPVLIDRDQRKTITDLERQIDLVERTQPTVELRIEEQRIVVHNSGAFGTFVVHLRIIEQHNSEKADQRRTYIGCWDHSLDIGRSEINNGHEDKLLLVSAGSSGPPGHMNFVFYHVEGKARREISQPFTVGTPYPPSLVIQITLGSNPQIRGGPVTRSYSLTPEGLFEIQENLSDTTPDTTRVAVPAESSKLLPDNERP
jgi:hypothetical protein